MERDATGGFPGYSKRSGLQTASRAPSEGDTETAYELSSYMQSSDAALLAARRARFAREARNPPPVPVKTMAWAGGQVTTSDPSKALAKLLARKAKAGEALTADQQRALQALTAGPALADRSAAAANQRAASVHQPRVKVEKLGRSQEAASAEQQARRRRLERKIRDCEALERRVRLGGAASPTSLATPQARS